MDKVWELLQQIQFDWTINIGQIAQFIGLILAFLGLIFTYQQIKKSSTVNTAQILKDVIFTFFSNEQIQKTYYTIGKTFKFDRNKFEESGSEEEKAIDQLLYLFECVGRLYSLGLIRSEDLILRYRIVKVFSDPEVIAYLQYLDTELYSQTLGPQAIAFRNARELAADLNRHRPTKRIVYLRPVKGDSI